MGQTAEPLCPRRTHMEQMLICLSIALIAGLLMSRLAKAVNLPAVTSYLVAGLLLGPFVLGRLGLSGLGIGFGSLEQVEGYGVVTQVALGFIAFVIGIYDGFYGPGTGTFLLLLLTGVAHMGLKEANGITKAINLTTNLTALAVYLMNGKVIFLLGLTAGLFSIAGNYLGAKCFDKGGAKFVKPLMLVVLVIFFVKTLSEIMAG